MMKTSVEVEPQKVRTKYEQFNGKGIFQKLMQRFTGDSRRGSFTTLNRGSGYRQKPHISFEFFPPKTPKGRIQLSKAASRLAKFQPDFISVTFGAGGSSRDRTLETTLALRRNLNIDVVPHLSCIGFSREELERQITAYRDAGFNKVLALRGDVPVERRSDREAFVASGAFRHANELVKFVKKQGGFHIFVACYPEGHPEAPSLQTDLDNFMRKVEAGADVAITQYFYNNAAYFRFVEEARRLGATIPIVVGMMPVAPYEQVVRFSEKCDADIPLWIRKRMIGFQDDPQSEIDFGVDVAVQQADELLRNGAPGIHFYTLNRADVTARICERLLQQNLGFGNSWKEIAYG
jgi:methylenetetrahydrofolate reductase (NADPH)